mmetsp:Transcript_14739/g.32250  ORF Transcript_14739/g.32250 Transcript_14739/m.32250 type:complete len:238 (-) Transcript_14739:1154-1867(-)
MTACVRALTLAAVAIAAAAAATLKPVTGPVQVGKLRMSPIGCGTWAWGNQLLWGYSQEEDKELQQTFDFLTSKGVNWFDTADSYGTGKLTGQSEKLLGEFLAKQKSRKKVSFCTKIAPFPWRVGKGAMLRSFAASKDRMQGPVDMVQLHWPPSLGWQQDAYLDAFSEIVGGGDAGQIGPVFSAESGPIDFRADGRLRGAGNSAHRVQPAGPGPSDRQIFDEQFAQGSSRPAVQGIPS